MDSASKTRRGGDGDPIRSVGDAMRACRGLILYSILFSVGVNVLLLTGPLYMLQVYDRVVTSGSVETLVVLSILAAAAYAALGFIDDARGRLASKIGLRLDRLLGERLVRAAWSAPAGGSIARGSDHLRDLDTYRNFVGGQGAIVATDLPFAPMFIGVIFLLHPLLGVFALGAVTLLAAITIAAQFATRRLQEDAQGALRRNGQRVASVASAGETVRVLGMGGALATIWRSERDGLVSQQGAATELGSSFRSATKACRFLVQSLILGLGAWLVIQNEISSGGMIAASIILGRALSPIEQALAALKQYSAARDARRSLDAALKEAAGDALRGQSVLQAVAGRVTFEDVVYRPPGAPEPLLQKLSLEVPPGATVGVIGPSGVGKSTIARLMVGALTPDAGVVRLDHADLSRQAPDLIGAQIGYLPQTVSLLRGSVLDNIARFQPDAQDDAVLAAERAGAHETILHLPDGYDTMIGEQGHGLSAGQQQRIGLARALFRDPRLLVLDEPNAHLDADGETALRGALAAARERRATIVLITHKRETLKSVDRVLAITRDRKILFGPRDAVLRKLAEAGRAAAREQKGAVNV